MRWNLRPYLGAYQIYGGVAGAILTIPTLPHGGALQLLLGVVAIGAYLITADAGLGLITQKPGALRLSRIIQCAQVPVLATSLIGYHFAAGLDVSFYFGASTGWEASYGGHWFLNFGGQPFALGINAIPLIILAAMRRLKDEESTPPNNTDYDK